MEEVSSWYSDSDSDRPIPDETIEVRVGRDEPISEQANSPGNFPITTYCIILKYGERAFSVYFWLNAYAGMSKRYWMDCC